MRGKLTVITLCYLTSAGAFACENRTDDDGVSIVDSEDTFEASTSAGNVGTDRDAGSAPCSDEETDTAAIESCGFDYDARFAQNAAPGLWFEAGSEEPPAPYIFSYRSLRATVPSDLVLPAYEDDLPLFERASQWTDESRCFELEDGARLLTEDQAYFLYRGIAESGTGEEIDEGTNVRTIIGIRGAYPGTFAWNGNAPDLFNDTLILLWVDDAQKKRVREFEGSCDVGAHDFGFEQSSFLPAGRSYRYVDGYHGDHPYSALTIAEKNYTVMDDTNANGHWDDDRNGRLPPPGDDYYRTGFGHNIHVGSVNGPLGAAHVGVWSAGCQLIAGMASWTEFIANAWTGVGDEVRYFLIDARDIEASALRQ